MQAEAGRGAAPWYREPWVWLVIAVPAAAVAGGIVTLVLATSGSDELVRDDFRKEGLAIYLDPERDEAARRVGARARLDLDATAGSLRASITLETSALPREMIVLLSHATRAEYDRLLTLRRVAPGEYAASLEALPHGHWYVELTPADRSWRLRGDFRDGESTLELAPPPAG
ncbi:MAG: hypothetical protein AMJ58_00310 [Gammaproteobacteria bacterium SG8_30]|jgi:hypothetical protein|nr:MAG: hypothetical protein AMJ58_00310 [Gammaproteobacteria bacterium SG8_30]